MINKFFRYFKKSFNNFSESISIIGNDNDLNNNFLELILSNFTENSSRVVGFAFSSIKFKHIYLSIYPFPSEERISLLINNNLIHSNGLIYFINIEKIIENEILSFLDLINNKCNDSIFIGIVLINFNNNKNINEIINLYFSNYFNNLNIKIIEINEFENSLEILNWIENQFEIFN